MASATDFQPADIRSTTVLRMAFGHAEAEIAAIFITNFLAASQAAWDQEISWPAFVEWLRTNPAPIAPTYRAICRIRGTRPTVAHGVSQLTADEHLAQRNAGEGTYLTVTDTFIARMRRYAS